MIPNLSPLQSKALFTFEFIGLRTSTFKSWDSFSSTLCMKSTCILCDRIFLKLINHFCIYIYAYQKCVSLSVRQKQENWLSPPQTSSVFAEKARSSQTLTGQCYVHVCHQLYLLSVLARQCWHLQSKKGGVMFFRHPLSVLACQIPARFGLQHTSYLCGNTFHKHSLRIKTLHTHTAFEPERLEREMF